VRAEFDGAAFDAWLTREDDETWSCQLEEETVEQARERMTAAERAADMRFECGNTNPTIEAGDD
jgi:hypothetical protein